MATASSPSQIRQSPALPRGFCHAGDAPLEGRLYVVPVGVVGGGAAAAAIAGGGAWPLAGGELAFTGCAVLLRDGDSVIEAYGSLPEIVDWSAAEGAAVAEYVSRALHRIGMRRRPFAGLDLGRPLVMGIVNVTPDSFSDGGRYLASEAAVVHGAALLEAGADILDVGGESTRPGARPVSPDDEVRRVTPVIRALAQKGARISVDTRHARVMAAALDAGATIINDITALEGDAESLSLAARRGAPVILMHMQGDPRTMQQAPSYDCAPLDVFDHMRRRIEACQGAGIDLANLCLDPGIGFGKDLGHNLAILARLGMYHAFGCALLLGASRKSFIARIDDGVPADRRLPGSLAVALAGVEQGTHILRVHDVAETVQAVKVWRAVRTAAAAN